MSLLHKPYSYTFGLLPQIIISLNEKTHFNFLIVPYSITMCATVESNVTSTLMQA